MATRDKIPGTVLLGFSDLFAGEEVVRPLIGKLITRRPPAKPQGFRPPPPQRGSKGPSGPGKRLTGGRPGGPLRPGQGAPGGGTAQRSGQTLARARATATRAAGVMSGASLLLKRHVDTASGKTAVGAGPPAKTARQLQAAQQRQAATARANAAAKILARRTLETKRAAAELARRMLAQRAISVALRKPGGSTRIRGLDFVGADELQDSPLETGAPLPPPPDMKVFIPDAVKMGGIMYNGEKGRPDGYLGSYGLMYRTTDIRQIASSAGVDGTGHFGYVYGRFWDVGPEKGIPFGDDLPSGKWCHVRGRHALWKSLPHDVVDAATAIKSAIPPGMTNPHGAPYGPLVGNPALPDFAKLRVDGQGREFFLPQEAPEWLLAPLRQAAELTAQAEQRARDTTAANEKALRDQKRADDIAERTRQEEAIAQTETQATTEAQSAQADLQTQRQQLETDRGKIDEERRAAEEEFRQAQRAIVEEQARQRQEQQAEMQRQMAQMQERQQARQQLALYPPGYGESYPEEGVDYGDEAMLTDDGLSAPGADLMLAEPDEDGFYVDDLDDYDADFR